MIKTLSKAQKMEREKFRIPRSVQDAIPIRRIFADGIFQVGNQYSKTWSFTDINYAIASKEDKTSMFLDSSELLNALDSGASAKITIYNRRINKAEFERSVLLPDRDDGLDECNVVVESACIGIPKRINGTAVTVECGRIQFAQKNSLSNFVKSYSGFVGIMKESAIHRAQAISTPSNLPG